MSTPDFDAAVERAARAMSDTRMERRASAIGQEATFAWDQMPEWYQANLRKDARAALQASGWEDALMLLQEFANEPAGFTLASLCGSARAWVARYAQASNDSAESGDSR